MKECWISPYGEVIYTNGEWDHASKAAEILFERYNDGSWENIQDVWCYTVMNWSSKSPTDLLQEKGWIRYSTISESWIVGKDYDIYPTRDQKDKIYDLTGFIYEEN